MLEYLFTKTWSPAFSDNSSKLRAVKSYSATYFWQRLLSSASINTVFTSTKSDTAIIIATVEKQNIAIIIATVEKQNIAIIIATVEKQNIQQNQTEYYQISINNT